MRDPALLVPLAFLSDRLAINLLIPIVNNVLAAKAATAPATVAAAALNPTAVATAAAPAAIAVKIGILYTPGMLSRSESKPTII